MIVYLAPTLRARYSLAREQNIKIVVAWKIVVAVMHGDICVMVGGLASQCCMYMVTVDTPVSAPRLRRQDALNTTTLVIELCA